MAVPSRSGLLLLIAGLVCPGRSGCVGTGGCQVPLTPGPPTPVSIKIFNSDIHLLNESEAELRSLSLSIRSVLGDAHTRTIGSLAQKGFCWIPASESRWMLVEGEILTVEAEGYFPKKFTVHLRAQARPRNRLSSRHDLIDRAAETRKRVC